MEVVEVVEVVEVAVEKVSSERLEPEYGTISQ